MLTTEQENALVAVFYDRFSTIGSWTFAFEYPGFFAYHGDGVSIFFTPDFNGEGLVDVQIQSPSGDLIGEGALVPYGESLTADQLLAIVQPYLDKYAKLDAKQLQRIPVVHDSEIYARVIAAMQEAEGLSGPEGQDYLDLMDAIALEAQKRATAYREILASKAPQ